MMNAESDDDTEEGKRRKTFLQILREAFRFSREELAAETGIPEEVLKELEEGIRTPEKEEIAALSRAFHIEAENLGWVLEKKGSLYERTTRAILRLLLSGAR